MFLTEQQLQALLAIIDDHHAAFIANFVSPTVLPPDTLKRLESVGLVNPKMQGVRDAYLYGVLAANLPGQPARRRRMTYEKLANQLQKDPIPLSDVERQAISAAQMTAGQYISGLGARVKSQVAQRVMEADTATRAADRKAYRRTVAHAIAQRKQIKSVVSDLGHATGDWARNLERVATTELSNALQSGSAQVIGREHGNEAKVAKVYSPLCCDQCRRLYSVDGTAVPKVFPLAELEANGTNVGRKASQWRPVVGATHPNCLLAGVRVTTARGQMPVEAVEVGDWVLTERGRWRQVTRTWETAYQGLVCRIYVEGQAEPLVCTANHPLATCQNTFVPARRVVAGATLRSVVCRATEAPAPRAVPQATVELWGFAEDDLLQIKIRGSFGLFSRFIQRQLGDGEALLNGLNGVWRLGSMGLVRTVAVTQARNMAPTADGQKAVSGGRPEDTVLPGLIAREPHGRRGHLAARHSGKAMLLARQEVAAAKQGDRVDFVPRPERPAGPRESQTRLIPRRVVRADNARFGGRVYNLSVDEDETYLAEGVLGHNCGCVLVHVPDGMGFDKEGFMVPLSRLPSP